MRVLPGLLLLSAAAFALDVGDKAPGFEGLEWVNRKGKVAKPGRLMLVQFWQMANIHSAFGFADLQTLHELDLGLEIVTICDSEAKEIREFLEKGDYTVRVGSDPGKAFSRTWGLKAWPRSFLVDKKGKIVFAGGQYAALKELNKRLDIERNSEKLLAEIVAARGNKKRLRRAYGLLAAFGDTKFDLAKWARALKNGVAPEPAEKPAPDTALSTYVDGKGANHLKAVATNRFNLRGWARRRIVELHPPRPADMKRLLKEKRYRTALDALATAPSAGLVGAAARDRDFAAYCAAAGPRRRVYAKKALMMYHWPFKERVPKDNDAFWREVSIQSWQQDDNKRMVAVQIGSETVPGPEMPDYARRCIAQAILMERIGKKSAGLHGGFEAQVDRELQALLDDLEKRY